MIWLPLMNGLSDSTGKTFVLVFPWNNDDDGLKESFLAVDLINHSMENITVDLYYNELEFIERDIILRPFHITIIIEEMNYRRVLVFRKILKIWSV